jgi:MYXO-CTERM domain-containing protein
MRGGKTVFKKLLYSSCALFITAMLFGNSTGYAQNPIKDLYNNTNSKVTHMAQDVDNNAGDDDDTDWGWIGLLGLVGLLGLRKRDNK